MTLDIMVLVGSITVSSIVSSWVTTRIKAKNTKSVSNSDWDRRDKDIEKIRDDAQKEIEKLRNDTDRHTTMITTLETGFETTMTFFKEFFVEIKADIKKIEEKLGNPCVVHGLIVKEVNGIKEEIADIKKGMK